LKVKPGKRNQKFCIRIIRGEGTMTGEKKKIAKKMKG